MELILEILLITFGLVILVWGADIFVQAAKDTALYHKIPPLILGMVIIGFGTSAPELLVSLVASIQGSSGISFGNIFGSNITNIGLGLGIPALFMPLIILKSTAKREVPIVLAATIFVLVLLLDNNFSRLDGAMLLIVFAGIMYYLIRTNKEIEKTEVELPKYSKRKAILFIIVGLALLLTGSQILVSGAESLARSLGVDELIIGLTVVAIGTSLPEIASSVLAVIRGSADMAFGNILGSNLFNLLLVLGSVGLITPTTIDPMIFRDGFVMLGFTILLVLISLGKKPSITRGRGIILILLYLIYLVFLISTA